MVGRTRYRLPLNDALDKKFRALGADMDVRVLGSAAPDRRPATGPSRSCPGSGRGRSTGSGFHLSLPVRVARELQAFRPDAVLVQGAHEAAGVLLARRLARSDAPVILDVHGDWRSATRLYGSPWRRLLDPVGDRISGLAVRHADAVRTISPYTTGLVRDLGLEPAGVFPAFMDLEPFNAHPPEPLPERPVVLFVGVLERYKNVDGLAEAWRSVARRLPGVTLHLVGQGSLTEVVERLVGELPDRTRWTPELTTPEVSDALDEATLLVLPSRSEGMGRVVVEAFCRGRPVVGVAGRRDSRSRRGRGQRAARRAGRHSRAGRRSCPRAHRARPRREARRRSPPHGRGLAPDAEEYAQNVRALVDEVRSRAAAGR